jgi:hypothetical protein
MEWVVGGVVAILVFTLVIVMQKLDWARKETRKLMWDLTMAEDQIRRYEARETSLQGEAKRLAKKRRVDI